MNDQLREYGGADGESGSMMAELFESLGFDVEDEEAYNLLVEDVEFHGQRSRIDRGNAALDGRCWKLGGGLEVWSVVYEQGSETYYADCRPAFRSRYLRVLSPWELTEYREDGEAMVRGLLGDGPEVIFELQNVTELQQSVFRESLLRIALAGIAYSAHAEPPGSKLAEVTPRFELAGRFTDFAEEACENDYLLTGRVVSFSDLENPATKAKLVWIYADAGKIRLEIIANRAALTGRLKIGGTITTNIWLQGHVLEAEDIAARYEGVDRAYATSDFWARLRREN